MARCLSQPDGGRPACPRATQSASPARSNATNRTTTAAGASSAFGSFNYTEPKRHKVKPAAGSSEKRRWAAAFLLILDRRSRSFAGGSARKKGQSKIVVWHSTCMCRACLSAVSRKRPHTQRPDQEMRCPSRDAIRRSGLHERKPFCEAIDGPSKLQAIPRGGGMACGCFGDVVFQRPAVIGRKTLRSVHSSRKIRSSRQSRCHEREGLLLLCRLSTRPDNQCLRRVSFRGHSAVRPNRSMEPCRS